MRSSWCLLQLCSVHLSPPSSGREDSFRRIEAGLYAENILAGQLTVKERGGRKAVKATPEELEIIARARAVVSIAIMRKQAETALVTSQQRHEVAMLGSSDGLWDWDMRSGQTYFAPRWKSMLGFADHELANDYATWEQLIHPDDLGPTMAALQAYIAGSAPHYAAEFRMRCKDGTFKWILARGAVLRDEAGQPFRMAGSHTDITERRRSEEALRASQQGFRVVKVSSEGVQLSGPGGVELSLHDMSDGYRSALALLIDLLRHMSNTYGALGHKLCPTPPSTSRRSGRRGSWSLRSGGSM